MPGILERILSLFKSVVTVPELVSFGTMEKTAVEVGGAASSMEKVESTSIGAIFSSRYKQKYPSFRHFKQPKYICFYKINFLLHGPINLENYARPGVDVNTKVKVQFQNQISAFRKVLIES